MNAGKLAEVDIDAFTSYQPSQPVAIRLNHGEDIDEVSLETVHDMFLKSVKKYSQLNALASREPSEEVWKFWTYQEYYDECWKAAKSFLKLGLERFNAVCIVGFTSPEWFFSNIGAILAGGVGCGIYTTNKAEACHYALEKSTANVAVVENDEQLAKILEIWDNLTHLKAIVQINGEPALKDERVYSWRKFLTIGTDVPDQSISDVIRCQKVNQCCQIIFTSGTTGNPKGVLLSHDNITSTARRVAEWTTSKHEILLSYLPMSHIAAQMCDLWASIATGNTVYFARPGVLKGGLSQTLKIVRPTTFIAVPRVWEKILEKLRIAFDEQNFPQRQISQVCQNVGLNAVCKSSEGVHTKPFGFAVANSLAFKKWHKALGLDRCWLLASCAAPLGEDTQQNLWRHHLPLIEMYGLSESTGPHSCCLGTPGSFKCRSVGQTLPGCETKLCDDGSDEVCLWGRNIMMGYLNMPEATAKVIDKDGFLHTGDIGRLDDDGFLYITGRIKDLVITAGGENIPATQIEEQIKTELPLISNCVLVGDHRRFLSVLLALKCDVNMTTGMARDLAPETMDILRKFGSSSSTIDELLSGKDGNFVEAVEKGLQKVNLRATSRAQTVRRWTLLPADFSITGGELGPTMKVRKNFIHQKYKHLIDAIYSDVSDSNYLVYDIT